MLAWTMRAHEASAASAAEFEHEILLLGCAVLTVAVIGLAWLLRRTLRPINLLAAATRQIASGNLEQPVPCADRTDQIGQLAVSLQHLRDEAVAKRRLEAEAVDHRRLADEARARHEAEGEKAAWEQALVVEAVATALERLAGGDLTYRLQDEFAADYEALRGNFNAASHRLQDALTAILGNAHGMRSGTGEIAQAADDLSRRTEQQAATLEQTAAALDEITTTVGKTAQNARDAGRVVGDAKRDADQSNVVVTDTVAAMDAIKDSANQISQIIGVIDEIAFQTNLLALNAGVEAARAGDAGRGFAVVASEVRALAQRSASAAREIKTLIATSATQVGRGVELVGETGRSLGRIVDRVMQINSVVTAITDASQEQAEALQQVNTAINQMDQVTQQNAAMVEQSTAASHSLVKDANELVAMTAHFQLGQSAGKGDVVAIAPTRRPAAARPAAQARAKAGRGAAAVARKPVLDEHGWEEF